MLKFVDPMWENQFAVWSHSTTFLYFIALVELVLAVMVFAKPLRLYGLIGLLGLMIGAIYTHVTHLEYEELGTAIFLMGLSFSIILMMWLKQKLSAMP